MAAFELHPALARDTRPIARLTLCELLLMNDARFPWCILVPRLAGLSEWHDLPRSRRMTLLDEIDLVSRALSTWPGVSKLNVGALGNRVEQLHIHLVGRHPGDAAWPDPVWGSGQAEPYSDPEASRLLQHILAGLNPRSPAGSPNC